MKPFMLSGRVAISLFRKKNLLEKASELKTDIDDLDAVFVYMIESDDNIEGSLLDKTKELLDADEILDELEENSFLVTPRKGTISPWSSKATDIFQNCGLKSIKRVERAVKYTLKKSSVSVKPEDNKDFFSLVYDRMTESIIYNTDGFFLHQNPAPMNYADILKEGIKALEDINISMGLALSSEEIRYLYDFYKQENRNPTDAELLMFGQVNSEHCRHKIFNASWVVDGEEKERSLFKMIQNTHLISPKGTIVAYKDNSSVIEGFSEKWFEPLFKDKKYSYRNEDIDIIMKVETHNHPTAISPYAGAATGVGGEIRDEGATGTGSRSKAGLAAFMVSSLKVPGYVQPWEKDFKSFPAHLATPLEIMIDGPIGGARFGNEFGRPQLTGIFRTYEEQAPMNYYGYHKPIMVAGGMGNIKRIHCDKNDIPVGSLLIQLGGPALKIGIGGGAASSMDSGANAEDLDFNSVQRDNAEMQRRCQEVINACVSMDDKNPILSIHDVGAGGLSNAFPELISEVGAFFRLREIFNQELSMSPMEVWCNESQERYVLAILPENKQQFTAMCVRERCPFRIIGEATGDGRLKVHDAHFDNFAVDMDLSVLLGKPPRMERDVQSIPFKGNSFDYEGVDLKEACKRVLSMPCVARKTFLITIADRSITGMVARDQMVGPWQVPVADSSLTTQTLQSYTGEAMSMGERTVSAVINAPASGRMAIGEALTNIANNYNNDIGNIKLSANWMCACGEEGEDASLYKTVEAVGMELCPELGISIPVGKDSLSMRTIWQDQGEDVKMIAPLSLIISAFSPVIDVRKSLTPQLFKNESALLFIDLAAGRQRMGGSVLYQSYNKVGSECPDFTEVADFKNFYRTMQEILLKELALAYHDRSDGGLFTTLTEMAIAGHKGVNLDLSSVNNEEQLLNFLFNEELGVVLEVEKDKLDEVYNLFEQNNIKELVTHIGNVQDERKLFIKTASSRVYEFSMIELERTWSELTYRMQSLRDNPEYALQEFDNINDSSDQGITFDLTYDLAKKFNISSEIKPKMAILREQGINGHVEMAAAFDKAGFSAIDVHMTDLLKGELNLEDFKGLVACGGFSYGDVLGAGSGWAKSILYNEKLYEMFSAFFARKDSFSLGVCNGCQMLSQLKDIIPGAEHWPRFLKNKSEQFEARVVTVEVLDSPSIFFKEMIGSRIAIPVAHGEGLVSYNSEEAVNALHNKQVSLRFVDNSGKATERYPFNPNGSVEGITGLTTSDGRVTIMMPHPERVFRNISQSWSPFSKDIENGPWLKMFQNAREFVQ